MGREDQGNEFDSSERGSISPLLCRVIPQINEFSKRQIHRLGHGVDCAVFAIDALYIAVIENRLTDWLFGAIILTLTERRSDT